MTRRRTLDLDSRSTPLTVLVALVVTLLAAAALPLLPVLPASADPLPGYDAVAVDTSSSGVGGEASARSATVSDDGRLVAFESTATNLFVTPDGFTSPAVYLKDLETGELRWINTPLPGELPTQASSPVISGDGSVVVFGANPDASAELVAGVTGEGFYRYHVATGVIEHIASLRFGTGESGARVSVSSDGSVVAFYSANPDLDPALPDDLQLNHQQLILWEESTGTTRWISRLPDGSPPTSIFDHAQNFVVAPDGSQVIWTSDQPMTTSDTDFFTSDVFAHSIASGVTVLVTGPPFLGGIEGHVQLAGRDAVSTDGGKVLLELREDVSSVILGVEDLDGVEDIISLDRFGPGGVSWVSGFPNPADCTGATKGAAMDATAGHIIFAVSCNGDTTDLYRFDPVTGPVLASREPDGTPWEGSDSGEDPAHPDIAMSSDGRVTVFDAEDFDVVGSAGDRDIIALVDGPFSAGDPRASLATSGSQLTGGNTEPAMSDDGRFVAFLSESGPPGTPPFESGHRAAYVKDRTTGVLTKVPGDILIDQVAGVPWDHTSIDISGDGRVVVVGAGTHDLDKAVFAWERESGQTSLVFTYNDATNLDGIEELSISDDGLRVAFVSNIHDLGTDDTEGIVSQFDGGAWNPVDSFGSRQSGVSLSGDGSTVVWTDRVPQVAGMDANPRFDDPTHPRSREVYTRDIASAATMLVSSTTGPGGLATAGNSGAGNFTDGSHHAVSDDGSDIAFVAASSLSELGQPDVTDRNGDLGEDVVAADIDTGTLRVVSLYGPSFGTGPQPETCPGPLSGAVPTISDDGRVITFFGHCVPSFSSFAEVRGVLRQMDDEFVEQVPMGEGAGQFDVFAYPGAAPATSSDGGIVAASVAAGLIAADTNGVADIYTNEPGVPPPPPGDVDPRISLTSAAAQVSDDSIDPAVSDDGRFVAFLSKAGELVDAGPTDDVNHLFLKDRDTGTIRWVDRFDCFDCAVEVRSAGSSAPRAMGSNGTEVTAFDLSGDGVWKTYASFETAGPGGPSTLEIWRESENSEDVLYSEVIPGTGPSLGRVVALAISDDGNRIVAQVEEGVPGGESAAPPTLDGIYLWDATAPGDGWAPLTVDSLGQAPDGGSTAPSISGDGTVVSFATEATNLVGLEASSGRQMVRHEIGSGSFQTIHADLGGGENEREGHRMSDDGQVIAFGATGPTAGGPTHGVFVWRADSGIAERIDPLCGADGSSSTAKLPSVSDDGRVVAYHYLCAETTGVFHEVIARSVDDRAPEIISNNAPYPVGPGSPGYHDIALTADGRTLVFDTPGAFTDADTNDRFDIYPVTQDVPPPPVELPEPVDDIATAFTGVAVDTPVLDNDGGEFDPFSLEIVSTDVGTSEIVGEGIGAQIRYTSPGDFTGEAAVTYRLTGPNGSAEAVLRITVLGLEATPLALTFDAEDPYSLGGQRTIFLDLENTGAVALPGAVVTVASDAPATIQSVIPTDTRWSCEVAADNTTATCSLPAVLPAGEPVPSLRLGVALPNGTPYPHCDPLDAAAGYCAVLRAWNGEVTDRETADPPAVERRVIVRGDLPTAEIVAPPTAVVGDPAGWVANVFTTSGGTGVTGAVFVRFRASDDGSTFVSSSSADDLWTCVPDGGDPRSALCTYADWPAFDNAPGALTLTYDTGVGLASGCIGVAAPCGSVEAIWTDASFSTDGAVSLAQTFVTVDDPVVVDAPDLAVDLSHPTKVGAGLDTTFTALATNIGADSTTGPITLTVTLPAGFEPTKASGEGWSCSIDAGARTADCTTPGPVSEGSKLPGILVSASVADDALDGTATAEIETAGDDDPTNDLASDPVDVTPIAEQEDGILGLSLIGPEFIAKGQTVTYEAQVVNPGGAAIAGPTSFSVVIPDGLPAGQRLEAVASGEGWTCRTSSHKGARLLRCSTGSDVSAGAESTPVTIDLTALDAVEGSTIDLPFTVTSRTRTTRLSTQLFVVDGARAVLGVGVEPGSALFAGKDGSVLVSVTNRGKGPATGPAVVDIAPPSGLDITAAVGENWTCTLGAVVSCANPVPLRAGMTTEPLVLSVGVDAETAAGSMKLVANASAPDRFGAVSGEGVGVLVIEATGKGGLALERDGSISATDSAGVVDYPLTVVNAGTRSVKGALTITEQLPAGAQATGKGDGWTCSQTARTLTCTRASTTLASGAGAPVVDVNLDLPPGAAGTSQRVIGLVRSSSGGSGTSSSAFIVPRPPPPAPAFTVVPQFTPKLLTRGGSATAGASLRNTGSVALPAGTIIGLVLPDGSTKPVPAGAGLECLAGTKARTVVACRTTASLAPSQLLSISVPFGVSPNSPDEARLFVGEVRVPPGASDPLDAAVALLLGQGDAGLHRPSSDVRPVEGLVAQAGTDQEVLDLTPQADGSSEPTVLALDGTASHGGVAPLSMSWSQTAGPPVDWQGPVETRAGFPAGAPSVEVASGAQPTFVPQRVTGVDAIDLAFELTVRDAAGIVRTDTVAVKVVPAPNRSPNLDPLTSSAQPGEIPAPGAAVTLTSKATDPDGDPVSFRWEIVGGDGNMAAAGIKEDGANATVRWPKATSFLVIEVTVDDGRNGRDSETLTLGVAPEPLSLTVSGPGVPVEVGDEVVVTADAGAVDPDSLFWIWEQVSGPPIDPITLFEATGPEVSFPAPAAATLGDAVVLRVTASQGSGAGATADDAVVTVRLLPTPGPTIAIVGVPAVAAGEDLPLTATVVGAAPFTVVWTQTAGPIGSLTPNTGTSTTFRLDADAVAEVKATVTDAAGRTASATLPIVVGEPFVPDTTTVDCAAAASLAGQAFAAATAGRALSGSVGPLSFDLGTLTVENPCGSADARLVIADASIGIGGIMSGSDLSGFMTETHLCLTDGDIDLPAEWGVSAIELAPAAPICLVQEAGSTRLEGSLTVTGLPFLPLPDGVPPPVTAIELTATGLSIESDATIPTGGTVHVELASTLGSLSSTWSASAAVDDLNVFGQSLDLSGSIAGTGGAISTFEVVGSVPGPIVVVPGAELSDLELRWDPTALSLSGGLSLGGGLVELDAAGRISDADHWELTVAGTAGQPEFSPLPDLTLDPAGFSGTVRKDGPGLEAITFDVQLSVSGEWTPVPVFSMRQLTAQLSNMPAPGDCPGIDPGEIWLRVSGTAVVEVGTEPIEVAAAACVGFGEGAWSVGATATFGSWIPVDGVPISVESLGINVSGIGLDVTISAQGDVRALGVDLGARVTIRPLDLAIVVDGFGDLSTAGVGLAPGSVGHVVLASVDFPDYRFDDAVLSGVAGVPFGLSLFAGFAPDPSLNAFVVDVFGLPPITALVVSAELSGPNITLKAAISLGGDGLPLFATCPADPCTIGTPDTTSLALTEMALSISLSGRIGFAATARLNLPESPDGSTPASELSLTAEIAIDLAGPAITLALFTSDGTWNGALGVPGLNLADLAIQGGVNFASPVPVPTVGFGATVVNLPAPWAAAVGMPTNPADQEAMSFVLNISQTAPILAIHIGEEDGNVALRPLQAIPGQADTLVVDYAELVIAPFGGQVGPYVFEPGLSMGFAGIVAGVDVDVAARVTLLPPALDAEISVGPIAVGGVTIRDIDAELHINTTGFAASFDGAVDLPPGMPTLEAGFDVTIDPGGIQSSFTGTLADWDFGSFARLETFTVSATANLATLGAPPQFSFTASGEGTVLGTPVSVSGSAAFSGGDLASASLKVSAGTFRIGPAGPAGVTVGGRGCDGIQGNADDGACLSVGFDKALPQPFSGGISGTVTVAGLSATLNGTLDASGIAVDATLDAKEFGSVAMSGRFYSGSPAALAGKTEVRPDGTVTAVNTGDWVVRTTAGRSGKLKNFNATLDVAAGSLGGTAFVFAAGDTSFLGNTVSIETDFSFSGGQFRFHAEAETSLAIDGHTLASGDLVLDSTTGLAFEGNVNVPNVGNIRLAGALNRATPTAAVTYNLTVDANVAMLGTTAAGSFELTEGSLDVAVDFDSGGFDFNFTGSVLASIRRFCVSGDTSLQLAGPNVSGWIQYCNRSPQSGFKGSGSVLGYTVGPVSIAIPNFTVSHEFGPYGGEDSVCFLGGVARVCLGAEVEFDVDVELSVLDGFAVNGSGSAGAFARHWVYEDWEWKWVRTNLFGVALRIDEEDREACATVSAFAQSAELCA